MKFTIRRKLLLLLLIIGAIYSLAVGYILFNFKDKLTEDAQQITITNLRESASSAASIINGDFEIARTIASTLTATLSYETSNREDFTGKILDATVKQNARYLSTWLSIELSSIDNNWTKPFGRKRYTYYQTGSPVFDTVNTDGDTPGSLCLALKQSRKEELTEPYLLSSTSAVADQRNDFLGTSVCVPLLVNGRFAGLAGIDITTESLNFITKAAHYEGATSFLVSNQGVIVAHPDTKLVGKSITTIIKSDTLALLGNIKSGLAKSWITNDDSQLIAFTPLTTAKDGLAWSIGTMVPMKAITGAINPILIKTLILSGVGLLILLISIQLIAKGISTPIRLVNDRVKDLANGVIRKQKQQTGSDELSQMLESLNLLSENMQKKIDFALEIGTGKFDSEFTLASKDDILGNALKSMQQNLKQFREAEEKRTWLNDCLAKVNEVIRQQSTETNGQYFNVLKTLIQFLRANQGALFVVDHDAETGEKFISLASTYAYGRKKFVFQRLEWGENLVGQCILEKEIILIKQVPNDYVKITSGLGEAVPRVLIIAPLKIDDEVLGALEIASFHVFADHEINFIQKACEIIASSIHLSKSREARIQVD